MPAYNAERFIHRALDSLARSTFACDVFIVDDGSKVPVSSLIETADNIRVIRLDRNGGLPRARNAGLSAILEGSYDFLACCDADDTCHPERIAKQVAFMDSHPHVAAVGTWGRYFDEISGEPTIVNCPPADPASVRRAMRFNMAIINTSAMIRTSVLREVGPYSENYPAAEDYELFRRILSQHYDIANVPEFLIDICESPQGITISRRRRQLLDRLRIQLRYFEPLVPGAWGGVAKTLLLFLVPRDLLTAVKTASARRRRRKASVTGGENALL